jgi:hypothetical protein
VVNGNYNRVTFSRFAFENCSKVDNGQYNNVVSCEEDFNGQVANQLDNNNFTHNFISNNRRTNNDIFNIFNLFGEGAMSGLFTNGFNEMGAFISSMNSFSHNINNINEANEPDDNDTYREIRDYKISLLPRYKYTQYLKDHPKNPQEYI